MSQIPSLKSSSATSQTDWATEVDKLYATLKRDHGVVDIKFAFGTMRKKNPEQIYRAVAAALEAMIDNKSQPFSGLGDSYGLKP